MALLINYKHGEENIKGYIQIQNGVSMRGNIQSGGSVSFEKFNMSCSYNIYRYNEEEQKKEEVVCANSFIFPYDLEDKNVFSKGYETLKEKLYPEAIDI